MFPTYPEKLDVTPDELKRIGELMTSHVVRACSSKQLPTTLYHYTNPAGFKGIIESGVLRATHISYTNDQIEFLHAVEVARTCVRERLQTATAPQEKNLLTAIERNLTDTNPFNTLPIAISCFCEQGDLLSQWRGYGQGEGGIAIGFDTRKIVGTLKTCRGYIVPVIYTDVDQRQLMGSVVDGIVSEYDRILNSRSIADTAAQLSDYITALAPASSYVAPLLKHRGFAEESEWRLIYAFQNLNEVKFLAKSSHLLPFVELPIGTRREKQPDLLPITEVWFGPGRYQKHAQHSCGSLLSALGYFNIPLKRSQTPFRSIA